MPTPVPVPSAPTRPKSPLPEQSKVDSTPASSGVQTKPAVTNTKPSKPVGQVVNQPAKTRADNSPKVDDPIPTVPYSAVNNTPQKSRSNANFDF